LDWLVRFKLSQMHLHLNWCERLAGLAGCLPLLVDKPKLTISGRHSKLGECKVNYVCLAFFLHEA